MMNFFAATAIASRITKVPVQDIRAAFRKGAKPTGKILNAVIKASELYRGKPAVAPAVASAE